MATSINNDNIVDISVNSRKTADGNKSKRSSRCSARNCLVCVCALAFLGQIIFFMVYIPTVRLANGNALDLLESLELQRVSIRQHLHLFNRTNSTSTSTEKDFVELLIVVLSDTSDTGRSRRDMIRSTWMGAAFEHNGRTVTSVFFAVNGPTNDDNSRRMSLEAQSSKDMFYRDHPNGYAPQLFLRSVLQHALSKHDFKWLLLLDDDCYFNPFDLNRRLKTYQENWDQRQFYAGSVVNGRRAGDQSMFDITYGVKHGFYGTDCEVFPPYVTSGTILMSHDLVQWVAYSLMPLREVGFMDVDLGIYLSALNESRPQQLPELTVATPKDRKQLIETLTAGTEKYLAVKGIAMVTEWLPIWKKLNEPRL